jgi:(R,R)-butanediol dehydrogenase / meso-butanediol dehydrogenase / diacetyl reductase
MGDTQVIVKPLTCGICGTDLHEFAGGSIVIPRTPHKFAETVLPQILGHEFPPRCLMSGVR